MVNSEADGAAVTGMNGLRTDAGLAALVDWAKQDGVGQELAWLLQCCDAHKLFHVNAAVQFLVRPSVLAVMRDWLSCESDWAGLVTLADRLLGAPDILRRFPPLPRAKQLARTYEGHVPASRIPLCLACRHPQGDQELSFFFEQLRVWLLIQGYRRAQRGNPGYDQRVATAADWLRKAADRAESQNVLAWINELRCSPEDDDALSRLLIWRIERLQASRSKRTLFEALRRLAQDDDQPSSDGDKRLLPIELGQLHNWAATRSQSVSAPGEVRDREQSAFPPDVLPGIVEDGPTETRLLSGRGLRMLSREALQFLPWSWHVPTPFEQAKLWETIADWHTSPEERLRVLAFQTHIAILTSRSLAQAQSLRISGEPQDDWTLTPDMCTVHRRAPRPFTRGRGQDPLSELLRPRLEVLAFDIRDLRPLLGEFPDGAESLHDLWVPVSPEQSAEGVFETKCAEIDNLRRLTSGMLAHVLSSSVYHASRDGVLAQVLSSGYRTAFGGNCSYASWTTRAVKDACQRIPSSFQVRGPDDANAAGSALDPLDEELRKDLRRAEAQIARLATEPENWIVHHNSVVTYVVTAAFAATGARPVSDPFESAADFDWEQRWVFVADKLSPGHSGRLVPMPEKAAQLLLHYRAHLRQLASQLPAKASALAEEIRRVAAGQSDCRLPFFFFLRQDSLAWYSVSPSTLQAQGLFNWHLPWNLMRHRLSTRLRAAWADTEIIDALLGHAERGVLTHGDYSVRCWESDMAEVAPVLDETYARLGFCTSLPLAQSIKVDSELACDEDQLLPPQVFGTQRREANRNRELHRQRRSVFALYRAALGNRKPEELDKAEWANLALRVQTRDGIHPHPYGRWRYAVLQRLIGRLARARALSVGRVFSGEPQVRTPMTAVAIGCKGALLALRTWFLGNPSRPQPSKLRACQLVSLAAIDLILFSRVTWPKLLRDVLVKRNFKIVIKGEKAFLEYHRNLDIDPQAPVQRFRITQRCATWLDEALAARAVEAGDYALRSRWSATWPVATLGPAPANTRELVKFAAEVVDQVNAVELPGLIAGYRAGRVSSFALPHRSWFLDEDGLVAESTEAKSKKEPDSDNPLAVPKRIASWKPPSPEKDTTEAATRMLDNIRAALAVPKEPPVETGDRRPPPVETGNRRRRADRADAICAAVVRETGAVSSAIWCFGSWIHNLARRDGRTRQALQPRSIQRYLNSLAARFLAVGANFDLLSAEPEEVAEFYEGLLDHHRDIDVRYVARRLHEFHEFLTACYRPCPIDWDAIDCGHIVAHASPGLTGAAQNRSAMRLLVPDIATADRENLAKAFLLLICHRYGARHEEAALARSRDWQPLESGNAPASYVLIVETYWRRKTKTPMSRRIVPQLTSFEPLEQEIIEKFCAAFAQQRRRNPNFPLFAKDAAGNLFDMDKLALQIDYALSAAHGGERVTEHKARHGFCDTLGRALLARHLRPSWTDDGDSEERERIMRMMLGTARPTRRSVWALARAMGHTGPAITFEFYFHRLAAWSDEWNGPILDRLDGGYARRVLTNVINLNSWNARPWVAVPAPQPQAGAASIDAIRNYIGFLRNGFSSQLAARYAGLSTRTTSRITRMLAIVSERLAKRDAGCTNKRRKLECLARHLPQTEWELVSERCSAAHAKARAAQVDEPLPPSLGNAVSLVSMRRQLLMWREAHFRWLAGFAAKFGLDTRDVDLICTKPARPKTVGYLRASGLRKTFLLREVQAMRLDRPPHESVEGLRVRSVDRCALVVQPERSGPRITGNGLVLLWVIYAVYVRETHHG